MPENEHQHKEKLASQQATERSGLTKKIDTLAGILQEVEFQIDKPRQSGKVSPELLKHAAQIRTIMDETKESLRILESESGVEQLVADILPSEKDWEQLRQRLEALKQRRNTLTTQTPSYRKGGCIYDNFFVNTQQDCIGAFELHGQMGLAEAKYRFITTRDALNTLERYQTLLEREENSALRKQELTTIPEKHLSDLRAYVDNLLLREEKDINEK